MNIKTTLTLALALTLGGCAPKTIETVTETETETGDGDGCELISTTTQCGADGRCWVTQPTWPAWAEYMDPAQLADALQAGALVDDGGDCYEIAHTDSHVCLVRLECVTLLARPASEVLAPAADCAPSGPWDSTGMDAGGQCWATLGDSVFAVSLEP